jgi:hypothetical protein
MRRFCARLGRNNSVCFQARPHLVPQQRVQSEATPVGSGQLADSVDQTGMDQMGRMGSRGRIGRDQGQSNQIKAAKKKFKVQSSRFNVERPTPNWGIMGRSYYICESYALFLGHALTGQESNQVKPNQTKSNQIKPNQTCHEFKVQSSRFKVNLSQTSLIEDWPET